MFRASEGLRRWSGAGYGLGIREPTLGTQGIIGVSEIGIHEVTEQGNRFEAATGGLGIKTVYLVNKGF